MQPLGGSVRLAGNEAREPHIDVRNRSAKAIRYFEIGWLVKDSHGKEFWAASIPGGSDLNSAAGATARAAQNTALKFAHGQGEPRWRSKRDDRICEPGRVYGRADLGTGSGGNVAKAQFAGVLGAASLEEQRLTDLYRKQGLQALVEEIEEVADLPMRAGSPTGVPAPPLNFQVSYFSLVVGNRRILSRLLQYRYSHRKPTATQAAPISGVSPIENPGTGCRPRAVSGARNVLAPDCSRDAQQQGGTPKILYRCVDANGSALRFEAQTSGGRVAALGGSDGLRKARWALGRRSGIVKYLDSDDAVSRVTLIDGILARADINIVLNGVDAESTLRVPPPA